MTTYPTIRNCNFCTREDHRGQHVYEALLAADRGCNDCDLIGALDALENTLEHNAECASAEAEEACIEAEEAVESAILAVNAAFENVDAGADAATTRQLMDEAVAAGDTAMVAICRAALDGDAEAQAKVDRCISDAAAMRDSD